MNGPIGDLQVELIHFLKEVVTAPKHVGALCPSSKLLAELMADSAHVHEANSVVEFGPGTGVFTEEIKHRLKKGTPFFAVEIQEKFVSVVEQRCPGVKVYHDSAVNTRKYLEKHGLACCDSIVSGLPFANFEDELQDALLDAAVDALKPGGRFVTFTYVISPFTPKGRRLRKRLEKHFNRVEKTRTIWRNILPAFAYCCIK